MEVIEAMTTDDFSLKVFEVTGEASPKPGLLETDRARNIAVTGCYLNTLRYQANNQFTPHAVWDARTAAQTPVTQIEGQES